MKNIPILLKSFTLIFISILFFQSCTCKPCSGQEEAQIPLHVLNKADQFIISKTGIDFFKKYITVDFSQSRYINPNYLFIYKFYMPEKTYVDETIRFTTDSLGNVLTQYEIVGIPECNLNPNDCDFVVDESIARQIANQNNLSKGIINWKTDFLWNSNYNKYVWEIISTNKENKNGDYYRAEGEKIIIDASNASVLIKDTWKIN